MSNRVLRITGYCALSLLTSATGLADSRIRTRYTGGGQSTESTILTKGSRQRMEYGGEMSAITQCDLKRIVQIIEKNKSYLIMPLAGGTPVQAALPQAQPAAAQVRRGIVTYRTSITDTGERKQLYGYTARHLKTILVTEPNAEACDQKKERTETDGWYIDYDPQFACALGDRPGSDATRSSCNDEIRHDVTSKEKLGYPIEYTVTTYKEDGTVANTMTMQTLEFATASLDQALFEVPAGYSEVNVPQVPAAGSAAAAAAGGNVPAAGSTGSPVFASEAAKQPGAIRVGIAEVAARAGRPASTTALKEQLRGFIQEERIEAVPLGSGTPEQLAPEAQQRQCDYILYTDIAELKKGKSGGFGGLLSKASAVGGLGAGEPPKEKFEAKTEFKLYPVGSNSPKIASTVTGKTGGGFSLKTAMSLASTAGSVASFAMMGRGMGFNPGMMGMFQQMNVMNRGYGMMGAGGMGIDPTSRFMTMMQASNPGMFPGAPNAPQGPQLNPGEEEAVGESLQNVARAVATGLKKK